MKHKLKKSLRMRSRRPVSDYDSDEMEECSDAYVDFIMEQVEEAKQHCKDPIVLIEQHLDFSCYVPDGFGTGDCIIISDEKLHLAPAGCFFRFSGRFIHNFVLQYIVVLVQDV